MRFIVKVALHDYPKRSDSSRNEIEVEASSREEALVTAVTDARTKWPGAKVKAFDVAGVPDRPILRAKAKVA